MVTILFRRTEFADTGAFGLLPRPNHPPRRPRANAIKRAAARDIERPQVVAAEAAIGYFVCRHGQKSQQLAFRTEYVDAPLFVGSRLERRIRLVKPRRHVKSAFPVLLDAVGAAA